MIFSIYLLNPTGKRFHRITDHADDEDDADNKQHDRLLRRKFDEHTRCYCHHSQIASNNGEVFNPPLTTSPAFLLAPAVGVIVVPMGRFPAHDSSEFFIESNVH